jgi:hypothetical protein
VDRRRERQPGCEAPHPPRAATGLERRRRLTGARRLSSPALTDPGTSPTHYFRRHRALSTGPGAGWREARLDGDRWGNFQESPENTGRRGPPSSLLGQARGGLIIFTLIRTASRLTPDASDSSQLDCDRRRRPAGPPPRAAYPVSRDGGPAARLRLSRQMAAVPASRTLRMRLSAVSSTAAARRAAPHPVQRRSGHHRLPSRADGRAGSPGTSVRVVGPHARRAARRLLCPPRAGLRPARPRTRASRASLEREGRRTVRVNVVKTPRERVRLVH